MTEEQNNKEEIGSKVENVADGDEPKKKALQPLLWVIFIAIIILTFPETVILLFVGMLPTFVAFIIDRSPQKYLTCCVCAMNITGVFPGIYELWTTQNNISLALKIVTNIFDLSLMYLSAAIGWFIYSVVPPIIRVFIKVIGQQRINLLRGQQQNLVQEWGKNVANIISEIKTEKKSGSHEINGEIKKDSTITEPSSKDLE